MMNKKAESSGGSLIIIGTILFFLASIFITGYGIADGYQTGTITTIERQSFLSSDVLVYIKSDASASIEDKYCLKDIPVTRLESELRSAMENKSKVTIHYHNGFLMWRWDCARASSIIDDVVVR